MHLVAKSIWIDCTPKDAFELHSNHANRLDWHDHVTRSEMATPSPLGVGSRFQVDVIAAKRSMSMEIEIIAYHTSWLYVFCAYNKAVSYEWDPNKAKSNYRKHDVHFADAVAVFEDEDALWFEDSDVYDESRFVAVGMDHLAQIITIIFTYRGENIRLISARKATFQERRTYEGRR